MKLIASQRETKFTFLTLNQIYSTFFFHSGHIARIIIYFFFQSSFLSFGFPSFKIYDVIKITDLNHYSPNQSGLNTFFSQNEGKYTPSFNN